MGQEVLTFGNIKIKKKKIYSIKISIFPKNVDVEKVLIYNNISFGEKNCKCFICCLYNGHTFTPLHIMLHKTSA